MSIAANKRNKRRKVKSGRGGNSEGTATSFSEFWAEAMKLKPEDEMPGTANDVNVITNGHNSDEKDCSDAPSPGIKVAGDRCQLCHKEYSNNTSVAKEIPPSVTSDNSSSTTKTSQSISTSSNTYNGPHSCNCKSCIERRSLESEAKLNNQMRHAWTQIRHLVRCAYHDPLVMAAIDSDEFKTYVNHLVSWDPHLLFQRVESQSREYVNDLKTRLLKQLTNGFNTPELAYTYVNLMFDEYTRLLASARAVSILLRQLEEEHLSRFNNVTLEQHNMHLFQSMVYGEAVVQHALSEILNQLRHGSNQHDETRDCNVFASTLIRYLKFDTEMTQISVAWRDVQKMMDDFNDERVDAKRAKEASEEERHAQGWDGQKQSLSNCKRSQEDAQGSHKLSLTLRQCPSSKSTNLSQPNSPTVTQHQNEESPALEQTNEEESRHDHDCTAFMLPPSGLPSFMHSDYLNNIKPPSVPSDDLGNSSGSNSDPPQIIEHPSLVVPSDLEEELDSIGSPPLQACPNFTSSSYFHFDGSNSLFLNPSRPFLLPFPHMRNFQHIRKHPPGPDIEHLFGGEGFNPHWPLSPNPKQNESSSDVEPQEPLHIFAGPNVLTMSPAIDGASGDECSPINKGDLQASSSGAPAASSGNSVALAQFRSPPEGCAYDNTNQNAASPICHNNNSSTSAGNFVNPPIVCSSSSPMSGRMLHKDSWSSSSSASFGSASTLNFSDCGGKLNKKTKSSTKPRRKAHRKTRNSQRSGDAVKGEADSKNKTSAEKGNSGAREGTTAVNSKSSEKGSEVDDDADDEYDEEEEEEEQMCKCDKCLATIKASNSFTLANPKPYPMQQMPLDPSGGSTGSGSGAGGQTCECSSCVRLAAVSFFAAQSLPQSHNLGAYSPGDVPGGGNPAMQSHFYNPVQDLHSLIHPHLYGLSSMGGAPSPTTNPGDQPNHTLGGNGGGQNSSTAPDNPTSDGNPPLLESPLFSSPADWDVFGKAPGDKLNMGGAGHGVQTNFSEWALPHQAWLNGGNPPGLNFLTPGTISAALQQYLSNTSMAGAPNFLQSFLSGPNPMGNDMGSQPSYMTASDAERVFSQPVANCSGPSPSSPPRSGEEAPASTYDGSRPTHDSLGDQQQPQSPIFVPTSKYKYFPTSSAAGANGLGDSPKPLQSPIFAPTSSMKYFSSPMFTPVPDFATIPASSTMPQPQGDLAGVPGMRNGQQPIRFHPGTSVSLKDSQFSVDSQSSCGGLLFNPPIMSVATSDKSLASSASTFATTAGHHPTSQHNPFMQLIPASSGSTTAKADFSSASTSHHHQQQQQQQLLSGNVSSGSSITSQSSVLGPSTVHPQQQTQPQIQRRKKLVAQSKLSKQPRPQQQQQLKAQEGQVAVSTPQQQPRNNNSGLVQAAASLEINMQKGGNKLTLSATQKIEASLGKTHASESSRCFIDNTPPPAHHHQEPQANKAPVTCQAPGGDPNAKKQTKSQQTVPTSTGTHPTPSRGAPPSECQHVHGPAPANRHGANGANAQAVGANGSAAPNGAAGANGSSYKYCNCCYCEFFGNGGPPQAPTSKNYPEIRERLRRKLNTKSKDPHAEPKAGEHATECQQAAQESPSPVSHASHSPDTRIPPTAVAGQPSVEELLSFIEGGKGDERSKRAAKRARQKQRKEIDKRKVDSSADRATPSSSSSSTKQEPVPVVTTTTTSSQSTSPPSVAKSQAPPPDPKPAAPSVVKAPAASGATSSASDTPKPPVIPPAYMLTIIPPNNYGSSSESSKKDGKKKKAKKPAAAHRIVLEDEFDPLGQAVMDNAKFLYENDQASFISREEAFTLVANALNKAAYEKSLTMVQKEAHKRSVLSVFDQDISGSKPADPLAAGKFNSAKVIESKRGAKVKPTDKTKSVPSSNVAKDTKVQPNKAKESSAPASKPTKSTTNNNSNDATATQQREAAPAKPAEPKHDEPKAKQRQPSTPRKEQKKEATAAEPAKPQKQQQSSAKQQPKSADVPSQHNKKNQPHQQSAAPVQNGVGPKKANAPGSQQKNESSPSQRTSAESQKSTKNANSPPSRAVAADESGKKSEASTPEKSTPDAEGSDSRKTRTRKQRKKNRAAGSGSGGDKVQVDQVFLPREEDSNVNEMDDAEKEIESFKKFCLDSTSLNKPKKITVNWKDFTFKKNLSTH